MTNPALRRGLPFAPLALLLPAPLFAQSPTVAPVGPHVTHPEHVPAADAALPTETPALDDIPTPVGLFDKVHFIDDPNDLWVRGRTYKANATPDGFTYVPYLGSEAPRNWPVSFRLERATLAGAEVALDRAGAVARDGARLTIDRGPVDVHYDVALEGVEQLFTFDQTPRSGAIELELGVDTELDVSADKGTFAFDGPWGGVRYGTARAFDASGRSVDVPTKLAEGRLSLRVPASFVESAVGAITVDPLIFTVAIDGNLNDALLRPDVAYDQGADEFLAVYENQFSSGDADIFSTSIDAFSGAITGSRFLAASTADQRAPAVASQYADGMALCVFEGTVAGANTRISGRLFDMRTQTLGPVFVIADDTQPNSKPDVGGNGSGHPDGRFLVTYLRDFGGLPRAHMRFVGTDGTIYYNYLTANAPGREDLEVAVSHSTGNAGAVNHFSLAVLSLNTSGNVEINGIRMATSGQNSLGNEQVLREFASGTTVSEIDISDATEAFSSNGSALAPTYLVTWDIDGTNVEDTIVAVCREDAIIGSLPLQVIEHADTSLDQRQARLGLTADTFVVTYLEKRPGGGLLGPYDVYATSLHLVEGTYLAVAEARVYLGDTGALHAGAPAIATRASGGWPTSLRGMAVWSTFDVTSTTASWNIDGAYLQSPTEAAVGLQYCYGTPNSTGERALLRILGDQDRTTPKDAIGTGIPASQFCLLGVGTLPVQVNPVPNSTGTLCIGGQVGRFNAQIVQASAAGEVTVTIDPTAIPTPTGFEAATIGMTRAFQFWYRDTDTNGASSSNFTNGAAVTFY